MGGVVRTIASPFKAAERMVSGLAGRRNHETGGPLKMLLPTIPALAATLSTGNPWVAAAGGATAGAIGGGGLKGALLGGVGAGLGTYFGDAAGMRVGSMFKDLDMGTRVAIGMAGMGAGLGYTASQRLMSQAYQPPMTPSLREIAAAPSFDQMKGEAMLKTEMAFQESGIAEILNSNRLRNLGRRIDIYNRSRFPSLRDVLKKRSLRLRTLINPPESVI